MPDNTSVTDAPDPRKAVVSTSRNFFLLAIVSILLLVAILINQRQVRKNINTISGTSPQRNFWLLCHAGVTDEERKTAFLELLKAGNMEWRSANLKGLDLSDLDLPRSQVENANFENSSMAGARFSNCEFSFSQFQLVDFTDADLSSSNLIEIYLLKAIMNNADFNNTNLRRAMIEQVTAHNANFENADLSEAHLLLADLTNSNFKNTDMSLVNLEAATLQGCNLESANLEGALLLDTDFTDSNWWRARGLSSDALENMLRSFSPSAEIKPAWEEDFKQWLTEFTTAKQNANTENPAPQAKPDLDPEL
jgi:uncharacterized protein YjbI with pentapeptide repeats